jgi:hypothetical protein
MGDIFSLVLCAWPLCGSGGSGGRRVPLALAGRYREVSVVSKQELDRVKFLEDSMNYHNSLVYVVFLPSKCGIKKNESTVLGLSMFKEHGS